MEVMERDEFLALLRKWADEEFELSRTKGEDYAGDDVHANFKRMHEVCKLHDIRPGERPEDVYLFLMLLKLDRLVHNLHAHHTPNHESLQDTIRDSVLYTHLLAGWLTTNENRGAQRESK